MTAAAPSRKRPVADCAELVRGVSPVLAVPFTDDGEVDIAGFGHVVDYVLQTGVSSVMFPGFASEFYKLAENERSVLTELLLARTNPRSDVAAIVAVHDHATTLAVRHARELVFAGADVINLLPPYLLAPPAEAVADHIRTVLAAVPYTGVVLQYAPSETGTSLDVRTIAGIAREHPNLRLVKVESSPPGRLIAELVACVPPVLAVEGHAGVHLPDAIRRGAVGTQPSCSFTEIYMEIWRRFEAGDYSSGDDLHRRLLPYVSYWMLDTELMVAADKRIAMRRGLIRSAHCRMPAHRLDSQELDMIERFLSEFADLLRDVG